MEGRTETQPSEGVVKKTRKRRALPKPYAVRTDKQKAKDLDGEPDVSRPSGVNLASPNDVRLVNVTTTRFFKKSRKK